MKKLVVFLAVLLTLGNISFGQSNDPVIIKCLENQSGDAKYLKDFRIQLGKSADQNDMRYKANISLWKNMKYRFTMCNENSSRGLLILNVIDEGDKTVLSSFDQKTGKAYTSVDFVCNKSGIYKLCYDFTDDKQGSGVGIVYFVK